MSDGEHFVMEVFTKYIPENKNIRDVSKDAWTHFGRKFYTQKQEESSYR